jgi:hypothetical protein
MSAEGFGLPSPLALPSTVPSSAESLLQDHSNTLNAHHAIEATDGLQCHSGGSLIHEKLTGLATNSTDLLRTGGANYHAAMPLAQALQHLSRTCNGDLRQAFQQLQFLLLGAFTPHGADIEVPVHLLLQETPKSSTQEAPFGMSAGMSQHPLQSKLKQMHAHCEALAAQAQRCDLVCSTASVSAGAAQRRLRLLETAEQTRLECTAAGVIEAWVAAAAHKLEVSFRHRRRCQRECVRKPTDVTAVVLCSQGPMNGAESRSDTGVEDELYRKSCLRQAIVCRGSNAVESAAPVVAGLYDDAEAMLAVSASEECVLHATKRSRVLADIDDEPLERQQWQQQQLEMRSGIPAAPDCKGVELADRQVISEQWGVEQEGRALEGVACDAVKCAGVVGGSDVENMNIHTAPGGGSPIDCVIKAAALPVPSVHTAGAAAPVAAQVDSDGMGDQVQGSSAAAATTVNAYADTTPINTCSHACGEHGHGGHACRVAAPAYQHACASTPKKSQKVGDSCAVEAPADSRAVEARDGNSYNGVEHLHSVMLAAAAMAAMTAANIVQCHKGASAMELTQSLGPAVGIAAAIACCQVWDCGHAYSKMEALHGSAKSTCRHRLQLEEDIATIEAVAADAGEAHAQPSNHRLAAQVAGNSVDAETQPTVQVGLLPDAIALAAKNVDDAQASTPLLGKTLLQATDDKQDVSFAMGDGEPVADINAMSSAPAVCTGKRGGPQGAALRSQLSISGASANVVMHGEHTKTEKGKKVSMHKIDAAFTMPAMQAGTAKGHLRKAAPAPCTASAAAEAACAAHQHWAQSMLSSATHMRRAAADTVAATDVSEALPHPKKGSLVLMCEDAALNQGSSGGQELQAHTLHTELHFLAQLAEDISAMDALASRAAAAHFDADVVHSIPDGAAEDVAGVLRTHPEAAGAALDTDGTEVLIDTQLAVLAGVHALGCSTGAAAKGDEVKGEAWTLLNNTPTNEDPSATYSLGTNKGVTGVSTELESSSHNWDLSQQFKAQVALKRLAEAMPSVGVASWMVRTAMLRYVVTMATIEMGTSMAVRTAVGAGGGCGPRRASSRRQARGHCKSLLHQLNLLEPSFAACQLSVSRDASVRY